MKGHTPAGRVAVPSELQGDLLDFSHLSFVHEKTLGGSDAIARSRPTIEPVPRGLRVTRRVYDVPSPGAYRRMGAFDGNVDRWFIYEFLLPGTLLMRSGGRPASTDFSDDDKRAVRLHSWQSLTPETEHSTHYFFQQSHPSDQGDDSLTQAIYDGLLVAFHDDRDMITARSQAIDADPGASILLLGMDSALVQLRRLVDQALQSERAPLGRPIEVSS